MRFGMTKAVFGFWRNPAGVPVRTSQVWAGTTAGILAGSESFWRNALYKTVNQGGIIGSCQFIAQVQTFFVRCGPLKIGLETPQNSACSVLMPRIAHGYLLKSTIYSSDNFTIYRRQLQLRHPDVVVETPFYKRSP
jgi:hypothetical protein